MACKLIRYEEVNPEEYQKDKYYVRMKIYRCDPCDLIVDYRRPRRDKCRSDETPEAERSSEKAAACEPVVIPDYWENDYYHKIKIT